MTVIAQRLERKLKKWPATTARKVTKLVTEIISLADRQAAARKGQPKQKQTSKKDPFFADREVWRGPTPADLAARHDDYLYGDKA